jgi:hypothetical protein
MSERTSHIISATILALILMFLVALIIALSFGPLNSDLMTAIVICGLLVGYIAYRVRMIDDFNELCKEYPYGILDWALKRGHLHSQAHVYNINNISYNAKIESLKYEKEIIRNENRIKEEYKTISSNISSQVLDHYICKYGRYYKYEIILHRDEIEKEDKRVKKLKRDKWIEEKYNELRNRYPEGLSALERYYSTKDGEVSTPISKEEIVDLENEIIKFESNAVLESKYNEWEREQIDFCTRILKMGNEECPRLKKQHYYVEYERTNWKGETITSKFPVIQLYAIRVFLEIDDEAQSIYPRLYEFSKGLSDFKKRKKYFKKKVYNIIYNFIEKLGEEKDIMLYYHLNSPGWTVVEQMNHILPIFTKKRNLVSNEDTVIDKWFNAMLDTEILDSSKENRNNGPKLTGDDDRTILNNFTGKYIIVIDTMTENDKLKSICKDIREKLPPEAPHICYISLIKNLDISEGKSLIEKWRDKQIKDNLKEEEETNSRQRLREVVSSWDTLNGVFHYSYLFYYYPTTCNFEATDEEWSNRWIIWNFKNTPGKTSPSCHKDTLDKVIKMLEKKLLATFNEMSLKYLTFVCIPASTQKNTQARYEEFSNRICKDLGMINAYPHITVVKEKEERRAGGTSIDVDKISFDEEFFKGKTVLLFDDVITRGDSMKIFNRKMKSLGATVIGGLSLGKTKHERP